MCGLAYQSGRSAWPRTHCHRTAAHSSFCVVLCCVVLCCVVLGCIGARVCVFGDGCVFRCCYIQAYTRSSIHARVHCTHAHTRTHRTRFETECLCAWRSESRQQGPQGPKSKYAYTYVQGARVCVWMCAYVCVCVSAYTIRSPLVSRLWSSVCVCVCVCKCECECVCV